MEIVEVRGLNQNSNVSGTLPALQDGKIFEGKKTTLVNLDEAPGLSRGAPLLKSGSLVASGTYLMQHGVTLPWSFPDRIWVLQGESL